MQDRGPCQSGSCSTDAVLPNKALPRGGLQGIASAVAANLTKGPAATGPSSSKSATAQHARHGQQQLRPCCVPLSAGTTVAGAAAPATRLCPPRASTTSKGNAVPVRGADAKATGTLSAAKAVAKAVAVTATNTSTAAGAVGGTDHTAGKATTTTGKAALLPAPQTKAEEARQLAMALSASMSAGQLTPL